MDEKEVIVFINRIESHDWSESAFFSNSVPHVKEENESWRGKVTFVRPHHSQGIESDVGPRIPDFWCRTPYSTISLVGSDHESLKSVPSDCL